MERSDRQTLPIREIERRALDVLKKFNFRQLPVDVDALASGCGIHVERTDLGEDCSGVLVRKENSAVIGVNWTDAIVRQRFTVAHELGHYLLHGGETYVDRGNYILQYRNAESGSGTKREEREANQFAAALLMPEPWVKRAFLSEPFDLTDDEGLRTLAERFEVSTQAMSYRLGNIGLLTMA